MFDPPYIYRAVVHRVVDGDTVEASINLGFGVLLKDRKIRLLGLNAPELREERGLDAKGYLGTLIYRFGRRTSDPASDDTELLVETKLDRNDKYGRILGRLRGFDKQDGWLPIDINAEMIASGYAVQADG